MASDNSAGRRLELYVRSSSIPEEEPHSHAEVVRGLKLTGTIENASVYEWGPEIGLSSTAFRTPAGKCILDRIAAFRAWADRTGRSMTPFFEPRPRRDTYPEKAGAVFRLPPACLAEYDGDTLVHVSPHVGSDGRCSVTDRLRILQRDARLDRGGTPASPEVS